jgi:Fe-S-cluster containining protein
MSKFLCSGCGACCRQIATKGLMPDRGDGACINLHEDNKTCKIYETRPLLCRVDDLFSKMKDYKPSLDQKKWNIYNTRMCHSLIDEHGISEEYKIDVNKY